MHNLYIQVKKKSKLYTFRIIHRRCEKATVINGIKIPVGQCLTVDVLSLHFNQKYWGDVDVNVFYPLRFRF